MGAVAPMPEHFSHPELDHHQMHQELQHLTHPNGLHSFVGLGPGVPDPLSLSAMMPAGMLPPQVSHAAEAWADAWV